MKKILATLLVATMLLSCMSVVSFAAGTVYTLEEFEISDFSIEEYEYEDPNSGDMVTGKRFANAYTLDVYNNYASGTTIKTTLNQIRLGKADASTLDLTQLKKGDVALLPVYVDGGSTDGQFRVEFDTSKFTYKAITGKLKNAAQVVAQDYGVKVAYAYGGSTVTGYQGSIALTVAADGLTNEEISINFVTPDVINGKDGACTTGNLTMKVNPAAAELPEAVVTDLAPAYSVDATGNADDYAAIVAKGVEIKNAGVAYDYATYGDYRIFFGKFVADTFKAPKAQGFVIKGGAADVKAAALTEFKAGAPFGILVFGMGAQTELTAEPFIEY